MCKEKKLITDKSYETVSGPILYNLTNDYMFKATLQESQMALKGLVGALLNVPPSSLEVSVTNPIILGRNIATKDFFLDVRVIINQYEHMNLEMQIIDWGNWLERSVSYTSRMYDNLCVGQDYVCAVPIHHVGFIGFDLFEYGNKFYDTFILTNLDNSLVYTNKFKVSVVNLKHIDDATEHDKSSKLDQWAKLITAKTWEELKDIAKEDPYMEATAKTLFELSQDFDAIENARRRNEYFAMVARKDATITEQTTTINEQNNTINEQNNTISEQAAKIAELLAENERLRNNAK